MVGRCILHLKLTLDSYSGAPRGPRASPGRLLSSVTNVLDQGSTYPTVTPAHRQEAHKSEYKSSEKIGRWRAYNASMPHMAGLRASPRASGTPTASPPTGGTARHSWRHRPPARLGSCNGCSASRLLDAEVDHGAGSTGCSGTGQRGEVLYRASVLLLGLLAKITCRAQRG